MKTFIQQLLVATVILTSVSGYAVTIISIDNTAVEDVSFEVLHNSKDKNGSVIFRKYGCNTCTPITVRYEGETRVSINGYPADGLSKSVSGRGDIGYNPETLTLDHINFYQ